MRRFFCGTFKLALLTHKNLVVQRQNNLANLFYNTLYQQASPFVPKRHLSAPNGAVEARKGAE
jgi:hypothetical protein